MTIQSENEKSAGLPLTGGDTETRAKIIEPSRTRKTILIGIVVLLLIVVVVIVIVAVIMVFMKKGNAPALTFEPNLDGRSTLIRFEQGNPESYRVYTDRLKQVLSAYENENQAYEHCVDCSGIAPGERGPDKFCRFPLEVLGESCTRDREYGYDEGQPCVLLRLDEMLDWTPVPYNSTAPPPPEAVKAGLGWDNQSIGVSCRGEFPADQDNLGKLLYWPASGWPAVYFPYTGQKGFLSPLVMVQMPRSKNGIVMQVVCEAWAQNIDHTTTVGRAEFEILID